MPPTPIYKKYIKRNTNKHKNKYKYTFYTHIYAFICILIYLICILMHLKSIFSNFQHFWNFVFLLLFLQNLVDGPDSDFHILDSSWTPSAVRHTVRSAAKNDRQSCEFQPILWHESQVMTKKWFWPTHFSQYQVAALSTYLLIFSKYNFIFWT